MRHPALELLRLCFSALQYKVVKPIFSDKVKLCLSASCIDTIHSADVVRLKSGVRVSAICNFQRLAYIGAVKPYFASNGYCANFGYSLRARFLMGLTRSVVCGMRTQKSQTTRKEISAMMVNYFQNPRQLRAEAVHLESLQRLIRGGSGFRKRRPRQP